MNTPPIEGHTNQNIATHENQTENPGEPDTTLAATGQALASNNESHAVRIGNSYFKHIRICCNKLVEKIVFCCLYIRECCIKICCRSCCQIDQPQQKPEEFYPAYDITPPSSDDEYVLAPALEYKGLPEFDPGHTYCKNIPAGAIPMVSRGNNYVGRGRLPQVSTYSNKTKRSETEFKLNCTFLVKSEDEDNLFDFVRKQPITFNPIRDQYGSTIVIVYKLPPDTGDTKKRAFIACFSKVETFTALKAKYSHIDPNQTNLTDNSPEEILLCKRKLYDELHSFVTSAEPSAITRKFKTFAYVTTSPPDMGLFSSIRQTVIGINYFCSPLFSENGLIQEYHLDDRGRIFEIDMDVSRPKPGSSYEPYTYVADLLDNAESCVVDITYDWQVDKSEAKACGIRLERPKLLNNPNIVDLDTVQPSTPAGTQDTAVSLPADELA